MSCKDYYRGKLVWVTGASSGIGEALVKKMAGYGASLIISSRRVDELDRVKRECEAEEGRITIIPLDLSQPGDVEMAANEVLRRFGKVDILFNNGGVSQRSLTTETTLETDRRIMEINYFSGVILTKKLLPSMLNEGFGHIIALSSVTGKFGMSYRSAYSASKHALQGFYETIWMEYGRKGIRTTVVYAGRVRTNISIEAIGPQGSRYGKMDEGQKNGISPEECALDILRGVKNNKREVITGGKEVIGIYLKRFFPKLFFRLIMKTNPL
jgi:short-subunit dehydrogenase